jgi:Uma2 family endonuclease
MPAVAERKLSLQDFHERYPGEKPYFEYWDGEAVQKSMPTRLHSLIQKILLQLLDAMGFDSGPEVTLKLDPACEPIPDVIATEGQIGAPIRQSRLKS